MIDQSLRGCSYDDISRAMQGMIAAGLGLADGEEIDLLQKVEVYHLVMKYVPADIVQDTAIELIASEEFFPKAATWLKSCDKPLAERQRMRKRVDILVNDHGPAAKGSTAFVPEPKHVRLAGMIAVFRKHGSRYEGRIAVHMRELWEYASSLDPLPVWMAGITVRLTDGNHTVYPEPPPEHAPAPEPLPFGVREPVVKTPEAIRTEGQQKAIDETKRGYGEMRFSGMGGVKTARALDEEPPAPQDPHANAADDLGEMP